MVISGSVPLMQTTIERRAINGTPFKTVELTCDVCGQQTSFRIVPPPSVLALALIDYPPPWRRACPMLDQADLSIRTLCGSDCERLALLAQSCFL